MGCDTCKQKNSQNSEKKLGRDIVEDTNYVKLMPDSIASGNWSELGFLLKIVTFAVIVIAIPFIVAILALQLFLHLFTPKFLVRIQDKVSKFFKNTLTRITEYVVRKKLEKRQRQFANTPNYEAEEFVDLSIHENNEEYEEK